MIYGLHGVARSGKDSIAAVLVEEYGFTRVALADAVRDAVYTLNPIIRWPWKGGVGADYNPLQYCVDMWGWEAVKSTEEGRRLLQVMGTEVGREMFGQTVWLDIASRKVDAAPGPVVVTDIRFENELAWIKKWSDVTTMKVIRPGVTSINEHASDAGLPAKLFDKTFDNNGTLGELQTKVRQMMDLRGW